MHPDASVWRWRRKAAGGRRNGLSEVVRRSDAANDRRKRTRLRFLPIVRDERALHGCERALVVDVKPQGSCFFRMADLGSLSVAATGDICASRCLALAFVENAL
jgi:hypothetical protein